jgi:hypothetical protein
MADRNNNLGGSSSDEELGNEGGMSGTGSERGSDSQSGSTGGSSRDIPSRDRGTSETTGDDLSESGDQSRSGSSGSESDRSSTSE